MISYASIVVGHNNKVNGIHPSILVHKNNSCPLECKLQIQDLMISYSTTIALLTMDV